MPVKHKATQGQLYELGAKHAAEVEANQTAAIDQMLAAWTDTYWGLRQEIDGLLAKVAHAKATGQELSPAWLYQQQRLKSLLAETKTQVGRYAKYASTITDKAQQAAVAAGVKHAEKMASTAVAESLPGHEASFVHINPKALESLVGFMHDGSVLKDHLLETLPASTVQAIQATLVHGIATGQSQDQMLRGLTETYALTHTRAVTILRTESLRAYRQSSRASYMANQDAIGGWVWNAHLDARTCLACAIMDGTEHPVDAIMDGHPRCRCAMVPRTKSWDDILGPGHGLPDTRPPVRQGKDWLEDQPAHVQRALMGPRKFNAWADGQISLDDMVARSYSPKWGTMRTERSMKAIQEDRNPNWFDVGTEVPPPAPVAKAPNMPHAMDLAERHDLEYLHQWLGTEGNSPQALADVQAAITYKAKRAEALGPLFPEPDQAKVDKAVDKLAQAIETKGYPSKGYSQVKAIYKAQANGEPGTQVGVVKSLTWEQKVTAQAILAKHDEALPELVRAHKINLAHDEALAINATKDEEAATAKAIEKGATMGAEQAQQYLNQYQGHTAFKEAMAAQMQFVQDSLDNPYAPPAAKAGAEAHWSAMQAAWETYDDAQGITKAHAGETWTSNDFALVIDQDGWATVTLQGHSPTILNPQQVQEALNAQSFGKPLWEQVIEPDPEGVKAVLDAMLTPDGKVNGGMVESFQKVLATPGTNPQGAANLQEALAQAHAMPWKPDPAGVFKHKATLETQGQVGAQTVENLLAGDLGHLKPQDKADLAEALNQWKVEQAAKATIGVPVPKPTIDPAKFDWTKASDAQVSKIIAKVGSGEWTLDDVYAKFQASKNSGPKTNYAKAILKMEGKGDQANAQTPDLAALEGFEPTGYVDPYLVNHWQTYAHNGHWADMMPSQVSNADHPTVKASMQTAIKQAWTKDGLEPPTVLVEAWDLPMKAQGPPQAPSKPKAVPKVQAMPLQPSGPPWKPEDLRPTGKVMNGVNGAAVWEAPDGSRWLFKPPKNSADQFLVDLDLAASRVQAAAGLKAPDTFVVTLNGKRGSIQRMFDAKDAFSGTVRPADWHPKDLAAIQHQHVLDWLLSNHDNHREQFLRLADGDLAGVDKGQAFKHFLKPDERLHWDYNPNHNYGALESVYSILWRDFAQGRDVEIDLPALEKAIGDVQAIGDHDLRQMLRGYAETALAQNRLPGGDLEKFLDAVVQRKHNLVKDFQDLYDAAAKARAQALPEWKRGSPLRVKPSKAAKWEGKDKPDAPTPPVPPDAQGAVLFDPWLEKVRARYAEFSGGKNIENSNNWSRLQKIIQERDLTEVAAMEQRQYLDATLAQEARDLIEQANKLVAKAEAKHKRAMADFGDKMERYKADLKDWKDANGLVDMLTGMTDDVLRHTDDTQGVKWAQSRFSETKYTSTQRKWLRSYTGSGYSSWNQHLRSTQGNPTQYGDTYRHIDDAMRAQPIPEDVILHRGTVESGFTLNGQTMHSGADLTQVIGSVQVDWGYMSTSVGNSAAFSGHSVQLKIRAPAGTPGSYVQMFSNYHHERELILARGTRMYVHNAYKRGGQWIVEVEIVPDDFDPDTATPNPDLTGW